jgi:hypothetical protein
MDVDERVDRMDLDQTASDVMSVEEMGLEEICLDKIGLWMELRNTSIKTP